LLKILSLTLVSILSHVFFAYICTYVTIESEREREKSWSMQRDQLIYYIT
jgi:hypothetical protein